MSASDDKPPTLASLRARSTKSRALKHPEPIADSPASNPPASEAEFGPLFAAPPEPKRVAAKTAGPQSAVELPLASALERRIWTVRDLVNDIRATVETGYTDLWVEGEISNFRAAPSGHLYFTLKDGEAQLPIVLFRRQAILLRFKPADGLAVLVRGRISIYESRGQLQLIAETLEPRGAGALQLAFEQLKARLLAEGLFDSARKRPLPNFPRCVGVITSPTGAVVRDIVIIIRRRHGRLNLLIYPAVMQGTQCCSTVAAGIRWFNLHPEKADLIIIARGGGSIEDLSGFNDESLARAIAASTLPIVSAIGHETDFTIADFVSDLRAPTPSAAAELVTAAQHRIEERVANLDRRVHRATRFHILHARQRLARLSADTVLLRLRDAISRRDQHLDELALRLHSASARRLRTQSQRLEANTTRLRRHDPTLRIATAQHRLAAATQRLRQLAAQSTATQRSRLTHTAARLEALSPLAVLNRGYAIVFNAAGAILRSSTATTPGQTISARLAHGSLTAEVRSIDNK